MQEMEARLAHAELIEKYKIDSDDQISESGNRELNITIFDSAESTLPRGGAVYYHNPQFYQPAHDSQQIFEQQQEAMKLMATTIGSTISKGFVMPKKEYMTFDGNLLDYPSFITNFKTNVEDVESDPNIRRNYLIQLCTGRRHQWICDIATRGRIPKGKVHFARNVRAVPHCSSISHRVTKGTIIRENENEKLMQLARDLENCGMNLNKLGYQSDVNSRHNISAIVLHLPKYLRSEWAKEAINLRGQSNEPNFAALYEVCS